MIQFLVFAFALFVMLTLWIRGQNRRGRQVLLRALSIQSQASRETFLAKFTPKAREEIQRQFDKRIELPKYFTESLDFARKLEIPNLVFKEPPFECVVSYATHSERLPINFPHPEDHFVIGDYLIDCPVIAADLSSLSKKHGRILGYGTGKHWIIADSISEFLTRLREEKDGVLLGR